MAAIPWASARRIPGHCARTARRLGKAALVGLVLLGATTAPGHAQQVGDTGYTPRFDDPRFPEGAGPRVMIDGAHENFHRVDGRFAAFATLLRADGYRVSGNDAPFDSVLLSDAEVLVIANALHPDNAGDWTLPNPSAFTAAEMRALWAWVDRGGALLLIADHMPFPGAAAALAEGFGVQFNNGFALRPSGNPPDVFRRSDGTLRDHAITRAGGGVDSVASFTGQAFRIPAQAEPLMVFPAGFRSLMPREAWQFTESTPSHDVEGWAQSAVLRSGEGRVAVFGEAAMFTSQLAGPERIPVGLPSPQATGNERFIRNVLQWLTGALSDLPQEEQQ